jgi:hypothetical protein
MTNSLSRLIGRTQAVQQQPPAAPPLHSQDKAPRLNQIEERPRHVRVANSLVKAGSRLTGLFRARQRDVGKHEQQTWRADLMREPQRRNAPGLEMVNSITAHAVTQKLNAEGSYKDIRPLTAEEAGVGMKGFLMRDQDNHYHQLQQSDAVISALKSSMPMTDKLEPAGKGHQAESSGIYTDRSNVQHTLMGRTLYRFDRESQRWARAQPEQHDVSRLSLDQRGELIVYHQKNDLRDHSAINTHEVQLKRNGKIHLTEGSDRKKGVELSLVKPDGTAIEVQRVGLLPRSYPHGSETLFVLDKEGGLHHKLLKDEWQSKKTMELQAVTPHFHQAVGAEAADKAAIEGFIADGGTLKAVMRDGVGLRHSAPLVQPTPTADKTTPTQCMMKPGWRLSEQMHLVNQNGLPERITAEDTQVRLHGGAALGMTKTGELCGWNETTQRWDKLSIRGVGQLLRGLDDKAYVIHDGKPKAMDVSFAQPKLKLGNGDPVALGRSTAAELGRTLSQERASHCAVLDDKNFVLLTEPETGGLAKLKASIDGLSVDIPLPRDAAGAAMPVTSVSLDLARHLYVAAGDNLYRLPHDQWTQSHHGKAAAWKPVGLQPRAPAGAPPVPAATETAAGIALATLSAVPGAPHTPSAPKLGKPISPGTTELSSKDGADVLKEQIKATLAKVPDSGLSAAELANTAIAIGKVEMGPNKRPVFEAILSHSGTPTASGAAAEPRTFSRFLELSYDRHGAVVLRPAKALTNPKANSQWETMQANNQKTGKIGNANGTATTTMLGSTTDNVRMGASRNIFNNAAEGLRKMSASYQHHLHPWETTKEKTMGLTKVFTSSASERPGMNPIYRESLRLYANFVEPRKARLSLTDEIASLKGDATTQNPAADEHKLLHKQLKALHEDVDTSSFQAIVRLGQIHKLLDERGAALVPVLPGAKASGAVIVLANALDSSGLNDNSKARLKLKELISLGLKLPSRPSEPSPDNTGRNKSKSSLLEDRILHDAQTLHQVSDLLERVKKDGVMTRDKLKEAKPGTSSTLDQLQGLRLAREKSDIKLFSDNGIVTHAELETLQQARDTVARELTGKHGLNYNTSRSFSDDLRVIGDHWGGLQVGEATALLRSKGATLTTPAVFVPLTPDGGGLYFNFGYGREHGISVETEGSEAGTWLGLKNSHSHNGFLNVGYFHAPSKVSRLLFGSSSSSNPSNAAQLYSADISVKASGSRHAIVGWISAPNANMANIMENLLDPSASLADLYRLGQSKGGVLETSSVFQQTLNAGAAVDLGRINLGDQVAGSIDNKFMRLLTRFSAGVTSDVTLAINSNTSVTTHKGDGQDAYAKKQALGVLTAASAGAYLRGGVVTNGVVHADPTANDMGVKNSISLSQTVLPDIFSVSFALDRAKNDKFTLNFKPGKAVSTPQLHDVEKSLGKVLKDKKIAQALEDRQALLAELERCAPAPAQDRAILKAAPLGGFVPPAASTLQRPAHIRLAELKTLLPRLHSQLPKQADQVTRLQAAIDSLSATSTDAQRDKVLNEAHTLAVAMKANTKASDTSALLEKATKAIDAGEKVADLDGHLAALRSVVSQLDELPHENETLQTLRYTVQQLVKSNTLAKTGGRMLASGEHKYISTGPQLKKGGILDDSALWRTRTSADNANAIATFISKSPVLLEMARRAHSQGPTSMELTLELKPKVLESIEASLSAQDPDIQKKLRKALTNDDNVRIKRLMLLRGATQADAKATPSLVLSVKSSASVTDSVVLASMDLKYSDVEQHKPISITPGGLLVRPLVGKAVRDDLRDQDISIRGSLNQRKLHGNSDEDSGREKPSDTTGGDRASNSANTGSGPRSTGAV